MSQAIARTEASIGLDQDERHHFAAVLGEALSCGIPAPGPEVWRPSDAMLSSALADAIRGRLEPLADATATRVGASYLELHGIEASRLAEVLVTATLDAIKVAGLVSGSSLTVLSQLLSDEERHTELLAEFDVLHEWILTQRGPRPSNSIVVDLVEPSVVVGDGETSAALRYSVTNTGGAHVRVTAMRLNVVRREPSGLIRLRQAGAVLSEQTLSADVRSVSSVDLFGQLSGQWLLSPGESDAFSVALTLDEGFRLSVVVHAAAKPLDASGEFAVRSPAAVVEFPIQSPATFRRLRGAK